MVGFTHPCCSPGIYINPCHHRDKADNGCDPACPEECHKRVGYSRLLNERAYFIKNCHADQKKNNTVANKMIKHMQIPQSLMLFDALASFGSTVPDECRLNKHINVFS